MELELKKEQFACYQALPQLSENREETTETIVPDYLPDIARIVDASGCLFLRSREIADGVHAKAVSVFQAPAVHHPHSAEYMLSKTLVSDQSPDTTAGSSAIMYNHSHRSHQ